MKAVAFGILGIALIVLPLVFGHPVRDLRNWRQASNWEAVPVKVVAVSERVVRDGGGDRRTEVDVRYTYTYQGKLREERYHIENAAFHRIPSKGDELTLRINPRDPADVSFNPETELPMRALALFIAMGFGVYFLFMVLTGRVDDIKVDFSSGKTHHDRDS